MYTNWVDPFIGTDDPGNCLCGPYLPLSLVRLGPDTLTPRIATSGYDSNRPIECFSHTHVSGTGGGGKYGNIGVVPFVGLPRLSIDAYLRQEELAESGYYSVKLQPSGIQAELTVTPHVGVHRYTFPPNSDANILIDAGAVFQCDFPHVGSSTGMSIGGNIEWVSSNEIVGRGDFQGGWGHDFPYSIYFYALFDKPVLKYLVAKQNNLFTASFAQGTNIKAIASFGTVEEVNLRVGISLVSIAKARESVHRETHNKDFNEVRTQARTEWDKTLSRIRVQGGTETQRKLFYTLFTRLLCMPTDLGIDNENWQWKSGIRQFDDFYCLWDSVRNANSLISLFDPELEVDILNALIDIAEHSGWLPDAWISGHYGAAQGGSSADILLGEAACKGLKGVNYEKALIYMRKNAEVPSPMPAAKGRYVEQYRDLGYVATGINNCVSRHLEYAYQDWCIATVAEYVGQHDLAHMYYESSKKIWNLWRDDIHFFAPKDEQGNWVSFDPAYHIPQWWLDPYFYEGTSWQWSFSVHHDFAGLIQRHGGNEAFVRHLDEFFERGYYASKESMLHVPYLYIYAGRPDKTVERVRYYMDADYKPTRNGLPDNEDMGSQSAWYMCSAMGLYPVMGQDIYLLSTPAFACTEIDLGNSGKTLVIEAPDADSKMYIKSAQLNGTPLHRAWITHGEISSGATISYELCDTPTDWGTRELPPSPFSQFIKL